MPGTARAGARRRSRARHVSASCRCPSRWAREHVPALGLLYDEVISGHAVPAYLAFFAVLVTALLLKRTRFGLRIRAVGENPAAVDTAGISVAGLRYAAVAICGLLCGIGGTYLAVAQSAGFLPQMTAGRGFIALAAVIFANWRPVPALGACSSVCSMRSRFGSRASACQGSVSCRWKRSRRCLI